MMELLFTRCINVGDHSTFDIGFTCSLTPPPDGSYLSVSFSSINPSFNENDILMRTYYKKEKKRKE